MTVQNAADRLGVSPWDVVRLVQTGDLQSLVLVEIASVEAAKEKL